LGCPSNRTEATDRGLNRHAVTGDDANRAARDGPDYDRFVHEVDDNVVFRAVCADGVAGGGAANADGRQRGFEVETLGIQIHDLTGD